MSLDGLAAELGLGPTASPIVERLRALYAELDADLSSRVGHLQLPCRAGCDACCHESVFVSAPEILLVFDELLRTRSAEQLEALVEQMRQLAAKFEDELELLESIDSGPERDEVAARIKFRCPLLGPHGACTVYASRELNARTFGQSWDRRANSAYGCTLTHARLAVLPPDEGPKLLDAREARARLSARLPTTERVQVYPWWFSRYGDRLISIASASPKPQGALRPTGGDGAQ